MNGPGTMYRKRKIINHDGPIELPGCMYPMRNIHSPSDPSVAGSGDHVSPSNKNLDISEQKNQDLHVMIALTELRQKEILKQLAELKEQMLNLKADLKAPKSATKEPTFLPHPTEINKDLVINASPLYPPYSLIIIQKFLNLNIKTYIHSTVETLSENAAKFSQIVDSFKPKGIPTVNVRLIWKNVGANLKLMLSQVPIFGEVNLLRFFARISCNSLDYESQPNPHEIDSVLDISYGIANAKTKIERSNLLACLVKRFKKTPWLCDRNDTSIGDIAAYSAIKQVAPTELNANLNKWMQRCEGLAG